MKLSAESRVMFVEKYLNKESGLSQVAKEAGVAIGTIKNWCAIYKNEGPTGLLAVKTNKCYSKELKFEAVLDYLNGTDNQEQQLKDIIKKQNTTFRLD